MTDSNNPAVIEALRQRIEHTTRLVVLTGAGMSAESGIPTFRQAPNGLWSAYSPETLATPEAWDADPSLVWGWYVWRMALVRGASPNAGHRAVARAAHMRPRLKLITQNVDDLHERAGSIDVLHLHGGLFAHRCASCAASHADIEIPPAAEAPLRVNPPRCTSCDGHIRPGVVWFGEDLPLDTFTQASEAARACEVMLVVGTSSIVYPAAQLPVLAKSCGALIVEVNPVPTVLTPVADVCLHGSAAEILPALLGATEACTD